MASICRCIYMKTIPLDDDHFTIVDDADFEMLSAYTWRLLKSRNKGGYACTGPGVDTVLMHRLIMQAPPDKQVDHINGNRLDNRRENLRLVTNSQNNMNQKKQDGTSSQYKGVSWDKSKQKWSSKIMLNGRTVNLGRYDDELLAAHVYDAAARYMFKEYARPNFN